MMKMLSDKLNQLATMVMGRLVTTTSIPEQLQQREAEPEPERAPESELDPTSIHVEVTSTPLPLSNQFDVLSETFEIMDESTLSRSTVNDSDANPVADPGANPGATPSTASGAAAGTVTTPPSNQEEWMLQNKSKEKTSANTKNTSCAFKVTVLSDSVLNKVDVERTEALCSDANCQLQIINAAATIGDAVSCVQGPTKEDLPAHLQTHNIDINHEDPVVIHTGTNHVEKEGVPTIIRRLERLEYNLRREGYKRVALSSIVHRRSDSMYEHEKIAALNNVILKICTRNGWAYVDNDNVDESCLLHGDKVHPNKYGTERLSHNIAAAVRQMILRPHRQH